MHSASKSTFFVVSIFDNHCILLFICRISLYRTFRTPAGNPTVFVVYSSMYHLLLCILI